MNRIVSAALIGAITLTSGCFKAARIANAPQVLTINEWEENPDVIWVVRSIDTQRGKKKGKAADVTLWGLFACYRSSEPAAPACFLAETAGTKEALVWPDNPKMYKW